MDDRGLVRDLDIQPLRLDLQVLHRGGQRGAHLRDVPGLGGGAVVHTLDEVPPVRAAVEDAGGFLRVARVEAAGCRYGIVIGARWEDLWWGITTHAERSEFAYTRVVA